MLACECTVETPPALVIGNRLLPHRHIFVLVFLLETGQGRAVLHEALKQVAAGPAVVAGISSTLIELPFEFVGHIAFSNKREVYRGHHKQRKQVEVEVAAQQVEQCQLHFGACRFSLFLFLSSIEIKIGSYTSTLQRKIEKDYRFTRVCDHSIDTFALAFHKDVLPKCALYGF